MPILQNAAAREESRLSADAEVLRWSELDLTFEMRAHPDAITDAKRVFGPDNRSAAAAPARSWSVDRSHERPWRVSGRSDGESMIPLTADTVQAALLHVEQDAMNFVLRIATRSIAVHAALLSKHGKGVLIVGPSLAGKTTLAAALWRRGWSLMSDDVAFVDAARRTARPAPRRVSLRFESRELVGNDLWSAIEATPSCVVTPKGLFFHPHELTGEGKLKETPLAGIFFLARREAGVINAEVRPINPARGALAIVPYALNVRTMPFLESLSRVTPLAETVRMFDLGRGTLAAMIASVETHLA